MNELQLSKRLTRVTDFIIKGSRVADIGSDHAYLPCYCVLNGIAASAIAGEVVEGPYNSAKEQVEKTVLTDKISVRMGDGLAVLTGDEADCITICGMGGALIASILEAGKEKLTNVTRLILQPNVGAQAIREWLIAEGWSLIAEEILAEDGKIYEILVAERGEVKAAYDGVPFELGLLLGPILMKRKSETFVAKWQHEVKHWQKIVANIDEATTTDENRLKKQQLQARIIEVEGWLA